MTEDATPIDDEALNSHCYWCGEPLSEIAIESFRERLNEWTAVHAEILAAPDKQDEIPLQPLPTCDICLAEIVENKLELEAEQNTSARNRRLVRTIIWSGIGLVALFGLIMTILEQIAKSSR